MDNGTVPADIAPTDMDDARPIGGAHYLDWSLPEGLREDERSVIQSLGAAVVAQWATLPRDVQRKLFEAATRGDRSAETLRGHIARFLHDNANPRT